MEMMRLTIKRVYEKPAREDGTRVLVDRLWPRGLTKEAAAIDLWLRDLAPSDELRKWYHENREAWATFRRRYVRELKKPEAMQAVKQLRDLISRKKPVTLLFASTNLEQNNAVALKEIVEGTGESVKGRLRKRKTLSDSTAL
jgi:uncharacterized protein YeaO (DUF488 family)